MQSLSKQSPPSPGILCEYLDCLMSFYDDKNKPNHEFFIECKVMVELSMLYPVLKKAIKGIDKRTNRALRERCDGVLFNFGRFLAYKKDE